MCDSPSVEERLGTNLPLQSRTMNDDFPTAASPANTTLYMRSGSLVTVTMVELDAYQQEQSAIIRKYEGIICSKRKREGDDKRSTMK
jgi:hypothetical protein